MSPRAAATLRAVAVFCLAAGLAAWAWRGGRPPEGAGTRALAAARTAVEAGRGIEARGILRALDPRDAGDAATRLALAAEALRVSEPAAAARLLEGLEAPRGPEGDGLRLLRAEARLRSGDAAGTSKALAEQEATGRRTHRWRLLVALEHRAAGREYFAREIAAALLREGTREAEAYVIEADWNAGDLPTAERILVGGIAAATDPVPVRKALGRLLLRHGEADRAAVHLDEALRAAPHDREARRNLATALRRTGRGEDLLRAVEVAAALAAEDPGDIEAGLLHAETVAASASVPGQIARRRLEEAEAAYAALAARAGADPGRGMAALLGLARCRVELIVPGPGATDPGSPYAGALEAAARAEALDPARERRDGNGVLLAAEAAYLRAKATRKARIRDDRDSTGLYEEALAVDRQHMEAAWDLALLYYDVFRSAEYQKKARGLFLRAVRERERRGLPALDGQRLAIVEHNRRMAEEGRGFEPGEAAPSVE